MIENAKVKNGVNTFNSISSAIFAYQDRFNRLPGDDGPLATLQARGGTWANITAAGNNNGVILVAAGATFTGAGENAALWQHLRAAGFISGNPADAGVAALPRNPFNGLVGFTNAVIMTGPDAVPATGTTPAIPGPALTGNKICMGNVPGKHARAIDVQLDDGNSNTGRLRATQGADNTAPGAGAAALVYSDDQIYTICYQL